jgi:hypothetical protein
VKVQFHKLTLIPFAGVELLTMKLDTECTDVRSTILTTSIRDKTEHYDPYILGLTVFVCSNIIGANWL